MSSSRIHFAVLKALASAEQAAEDQLANEIGQEPRLVALALYDLERHGLVQESIGHTIDCPVWEPTRDGYAVAHSGGSTLGEALGRLSTPDRSVTNTFSIGTNYGNAAQGAGNTQSQTTVDPAALSGLLEVMRTHGDNKTADEVENLKDSGDTKGALQKLVERFSGKAVDTTADHAVDYAAKALPLLAALLGGALGIPVG